MTETLRTMSESQCEDDVAKNVAHAMGAEATVDWRPNGNPITVNSPPDGTYVAYARTGSGPGSRPAGTASNGHRGFLVLRPASSRAVLLVEIITPPDQDAKRAAPNHSLLSKVDEAVPQPGLRGMLHLVADYTGSA
jgi:amidohydrolase